MKKLFTKLNRMLTAIAHAEAGDLDAVKALLDQDKTPSSTPAAKGEIPSQCAVILEFKRAERPAKKQIPSAANLGVRP